MTNHIAERARNASFCTVPDSDGSLPCLSGSGQSAFNLQAPVVYGEFNAWACADRASVGPNGGTSLPDEDCAMGYGIAPLLRDRFGVGAFPKTHFNEMRIQVFQVRQNALAAPATGAGSRGR